MRAKAAYDAAFLWVVVRAFADALRDRHRRFARAECPSCKGRFRILGIVDDESVARQFIDEVSLPAPERATPQRSSLPWTTTPDARRPRHASVATIPTTHLA